jgi:hypothetical protein
MLTTGSHNHNRRPGLTTVTYVIRGSYAELENLPIMLPSNSVSGATAPSPAKRTPQCACRRSVVYSAYNIEGDGRVLPGVDSEYEEI